MASGVGTSMELAVGALSVLGRSGVTQAGGGLGIDKCYDMWGMRRIWVSLWPLLVCGHCSSVVVKVQSRQTHHVGGGRLSRRQDGALH